MNAPQTLGLRTGGQLIVDQLLVHGVEAAFCVPGESYLAVLDALYDVRDRIRLVVARQDGGAAYMAEGYAKASGKPGICFVTRGPGATNASIAVHTAFQDSTPMILFVGQVGSDFVEREAFQEIDYRRMFGQMAKWVAQIDRADRIAEYVSHAFHLAMSGRPGPVVLALPEDMLVQSAAPTPVKPYQIVQASPAPEAIERLRAMLAAAERPLAILGGSVWSPSACADFQRFAENTGLPVGCAFRFQDLFDNRHPNYAGDVGIGLNPQLAERVRTSDLLLVVGARLGEMTTQGYTLVAPPVPRQPLVHVHAGAEELGRVYQAELLINSGVAQFARAVRDLRVDSAKRREWLASARADYEAWQQPRAIPGKVQLQEIALWLRDHVPADTIVCTGAGNFSGFLNRYYRFTGWRTQVAPTSGSMGYGTPAAIGAQVAYPDKLVVCFNGDGDYLMNGQEIAAAVQYEQPIVYVVVNNGMYGTIRMHQEREYPGRVYATALHNPDFAALARAYGAHGETVEETAQFAGAFERSVAHGKKTRRPSLIEVRIDPNAITTATTLDAIRSAALARGVSGQ
jgi:acetolactate synthase I/II/III large subunit